MDDRTHADEVNDRFRHNLKSLREHAGWNQPELARRMVDQGWPTYSQMTVKRTEEGDRAVPLAEAVGLAEVFGVKVEALLLSPDSEKQFAKVRRAVIDLRAARSDLKSSYRSWLETKINSEFTMTIADGKSYEGVDLEKLLKFNLDQDDLGQLTAESVLSVLREADKELGIDHDNKLGVDSGEHPEDD